MTRTAAVKKLQARAARPPGPRLPARGAGASLSSPEVTRTSRQQENKQLQGLNTRLAGLIDKVTLITRVEMMINDLGENVRVR